MNFCSKCGSRLENGSCPNCSTISNSNKNKNYFKLIIGFIIILFILIGGIFIYGKSTSKTQSEIAMDFSNAISNKNADELQEILYCDNQKLQINTTNANVLIDYFTKNPSKFSDINDNFNAGKYVDTGYPLSIKEISKKFFFFPVYKVVVKPTFMKVKCNFKNFKIKVLDQTYSDLNESTEIGPLMPGNYNITAELSNSYLNKSEVIDVNTFDNNCPNIEVFKDLKIIHIDSDIPNADLYINNKNTGIKVKDAKDFGPVDPNSTIYAISNENGQKLMSKKYTVDSSSEIYINFADAKASEDDFKTELYSLLNNYSSGFAYAVNYNDFNYIASYLKENSPIYNKQKKVVPDIYKQNITESFNSTEILNYKFNNDTNTGEVTCNEVYSIAKNNNVPKYKEFKNTYTFERNSNGLLVLTDIKD